MKQKPSLINNAAYPAEIRSLSLCLLYCKIILLYRIFHCHTYLLTFFLHSLWGKNCPAGQFFLLFSQKHTSKLPLREACKKSFTNAEDHNAQGAERFFRKPKQPPGADGSGKLPACQKCFVMECEQYARQRASNRKLQLAAIFIKQIARIYELFISY